MSWWGGGLMSDWPGCARRSEAMSGVTFLAGNCPPSPGLEPCAILISSWSARARYVTVTPKRADATCLIGASRRTPPTGSYHDGSSPPSPVLAAPPASSRPAVTAWCASGDSAPRLIAAPTKRRAIDSTGSTSSIGTRRRAGRTRRRSRTVAGWRASAAR
jgi:hypothetical protein